MRKICAAVMVLALLAAPVAWAQKYQEGVHYFNIDHPDTTPRDYVEVTEVFSYLCTHCKDFEPYIDHWLPKQPADVHFSRIPVEFGRATWGLYARAYVAASVLGIENKSHVAMMDAIWKDHKQMRTMDQLADWYSQFGVDKDRFMATAQSFAVDMRLRREQQEAKDYGVNGTPTMIVDRKYRVSAGGAVSDFDTMLDVVDFLVAKDLAELKARKPETSPSK